MKRKTTLALALALLLTTGLLTGCADTPEGAQTAGTSQTSSPDAASDAKQESAAFTDEMKIPYAVDLSPEDGADAVERQDDLWDRVGTLLGDRIVAVHFKGETFAPDGSPRSASLEDSVIDFASAFRMLRTLPQTLPVLREEAVPERAASDIALIRSHFEG